MDNKTKKLLFDSIEPENIWAIIVNHLPVLKKEVINLLELK